MGHWIVISSDGVGGTFDEIVIGCSDRDLVRVIAVLFGSWLRTSSAEAPSIREGGALSTTQDSPTNHVDSAGARPTAAIWPGNDSVVRFKDTRLPIGPLSRDELFARHGIRGAELHSNYVRMRDGRFVRADMARDMGVLVNQAVARFPDGVIGFWGAAHMYGHPWMPWDALPTVFADKPRTIPVDAIGFRRHLDGEAVVGKHGPPQFAVAHDRLPDRSIIVVNGVQCTSPLRTAFDLARIRNLPEAVAAVDGMCAVMPGLTHRIRDAASTTDRSIRDLARFREVANLASSRAESPWESRTRVLMHQIGLPDLVEQHSVQIVIDGRTYTVRMDLASIRAKTGVEFMGKHHKYEQNRRWDELRAAGLARQGWKLLSVEARDVTTRWRATSKMVRDTIMERIAALESDPTRS